MFVETFTRVKPAILGTEKEEEMVNIAFYMSPFPILFYQCCNNLTTRLVLGNAYHFATQILLIS